MDKTKNVIPKEMSQNGLKSYASQKDRKLLNSPTWFTHKLSHNFPFLIIASSFEW